MDLKILKIAANTENIYLKLFVISILVINTTDKDKKNVAILLKSFN